VQESYHITGKDKKDKDDAYRTVPVSAFLFCTKSVMGVGRSTPVTVPGCILAPAQSPAGQCPSRHRSWFRNRTESIVVTLSSKNPPPQCPSDCAQVRVPSWAGRPTGKAPSVGDFAFFGMSKDRTDIGDSVEYIYIRKLRRDLHGFLQGWRRSPGSTMPFSRVCLRSGSGPERDQHLKPGCSRNWLSQRAP
jgi:hypothetical protein